MKPVVLTFIVCVCISANGFAQQLPLVYDVENTGANYQVPYLPTLGELPAIQSLPDPFMWADGRGRISHFSDWRYRRAEIGAQLQNYEIGQKPPRPDSITASYSADTLRVAVTLNGKTLTLKAYVLLPAGPGPFPAAIAMVGPFGFASNSIFSSRNIAQIAYVHDQVTTYNSPQNTDPYYQLYGPALNVDNTGQYSAWAWGVSRIIDGLELVQASLPIDLKHLAVIGCSYAGKMALFSGAFDERIALTIAQESGGGGATSWRYSNTEPTDQAHAVETLSATSHQWFMEPMFQFGGANVSKLPEDHHELMAMVAPRALWASGNPDYIWLSNPSCYVCSEACKRVYEALGISDRYGYSVVGGHSHCAIPSNQVTEIGAFADKFLLGKDTANTSNIADRPSAAPYNTIDLSVWMPWTTPTLGTGTQYMGRTSLVSPSNSQKGLDTSVTFTWNKDPNADKYFIQLSSNVAFPSIVRIDSTTDTLMTVAHLGVGKKYFWHVIADSAGSTGPASSVWSFSTYIPMPAAPELLDVTPLNPGKADSMVFKWKKALNADLYIFQMATTPAFSTQFVKDSTADTVKIVRNLINGRTYYWRVRSENVSGYSDWTDTSVTITVTGIKEVGGIPTEFSISQNYPNPFNPTTTIRFGLPKAGLTKIIIYDLVGREVRSMVNQVLEAGYHEVTLDASDLTSGVYFYKIQSGGFSQTKKMIVLK